MTLTFTQEDRGFVAHAEVHNDYNLRVEANGPFYLQVSQKTSGNKYFYVTSGNYQDRVEIEFDGCVWPKQVEIVSSVNPDVAIITEAQ